jgi:hypothetical protein
MKIVVNKCYGGFGLSADAYRELGPTGKNLCNNWGVYDFSNEFRSNPKLVAIVEKLGDAASGQCAKLCVVEVPDDVEWQIEERDGYEHVAEKHRTW